MAAPLLVVLQQIINTRNGVAHQYDRPKIESSEEEDPAEYIVRDGFKMKRMPGGGYDPIE